MPISTAEPTDGGARRRCGGRAGFTLIEVTLVLLILSIVLALTIPRLRSKSGMELSAQARRLSNTFKYLRSEAILDGRAYQLRYDLNADRYWATSLSGGSGQAVASAKGGAALGLLAQPFTLPSPIAFSDIILPQSVGKIQDGQAVTNFYPDGSVDLTVIHLDDGNYAYTLYVYPYSGRLRLSQGYQDIDYGG